MIRVAIFNFPTCMFYNSLYFDSIFQHSPHILWLLPQLCNIPNFARMILLVIVSDFELGKIDCAKF